MPLARSIEKMLKRDAFRQIAGGCVQTGLLKRREHAGVERVGATPEHSAITNEEQSVMVAAKAAWLRADWT